MALDTDYASWVLGLEKKEGKEGREKGRLRTLLFNVLPLARPRSFCDCLGE